MNLPAAKVPGLIVPKIGWYGFPAEMELKEAAALITNARESLMPKNYLVDDDAIIATIVDGEYNGVMEVATLLSSV